MRSSDIEALVQEAAGDVLEAVLKAKKLGLPVAPFAKAFSKTFDFVPNQLVLAALDEKAKLPPWVRAEVGEALEDLLEDEVEALDAVYAERRRAHEARDPGDGSER